MHNSLHQLGFHPRPLRHFNACLYEALYMYWYVICGCMITFLIM